VVLDPIELYRIQHNPFTIIFLFCLFVFAVTASDTIPTAPSTSTLPSIITPQRIYTTNLITSKECELLRQWNDQHGLDYHRFNEILVTSRRTHPHRHREQFQHILDATTKRVQDQLVRLNVNITRLAIDEAVLVRTAPAGQVLHADSQTLDGKPNHTPHRVWSVSIGCSEKNTYSGGYFEFIDSSHKDEARSFQLHVGNGLIFSSGIENAHSVAPVLTGKRYQLLIWFVDVKNSMEHQQKNEIKLISEWLLRHNLPQLQRFFKEFISHNMLKHISGVHVDVEQFPLLHTGTLARIGLSPIEQRKLQQLFLRERALQVEL
jgi:hypothetical protein